MAVKLWTLYEHLRAIVIHWYLFEKTKGDHNDIQTISTLN